MLNQPNIFNLYIMHKKCIDLFKEAHVCAFASRVAAAAEKSLFYTQQKGKYMSLILK